MWRAALRKQIMVVNQLPQPPDVLQLLHADAGPKSMAQSSLNPVMAKSTLIGFAFSNSSLSTR